MLFNNVTDLILDTIVKAFGGLEVIGVPTDALAVLGEILAYGTWVIGADMLSLIITTIVTWWTLKFTVGVVLWVWEILPLT